MKTFLGLSIGLLLFGLQGHSQSEPFISTMDFVEVLNGNREEAHYYYNHNWKQIREKAKINGNIHSFYTPNHSDMLKVLFDNAPETQEEQDSILEVFYGEVEKMAENSFIINCMIEREIRDAAERIHNDLLKKANWPILNRTEKSKAA